MAAGAMIAGATLTAFGADIINPEAAFAETVTPNDLGYPWKDAPCEFTNDATHPNPTCANPAPGHSDDRYDWGEYDDNHTFHQYRDGGYEYRNCTDYVRWKVESLGKTVSLKLGNGGQWYDKVSETMRSSMPKAGEAAVVPGSIGHIAFVESVHEDGTITVSEYNHDTHGHGDYRTGKPKDMGFTEFIDFGIDPHAVQPGSGGSSSTSTRMMIVNAAGAAYESTNVTPGGSWTRVSGDGDARAIAAAGQKMVLINSIGDAYVSDKPESGWTPLFVSGGATQVDTDTTGRIVAINRCGALYARDPATGWVQETSCGDALAAATGGGRMMLINSCGGAYAKNGLYDAWTQVLACGDARAIAVGESQRMMAITSCGSAVARNNITGDYWRQKTSCGDARAIAYGRNRLMVITGGGAAFAGDNVDGGFTRVTADGDARQIAVGSDDRMMIVNSLSAAYAKTDLASGTGGWTWLTGNGDALKIAAG